MHLSKSAILTRGAAVFFLVFGLGPAPATRSARAEPAEYQVNIREACRREVAGAYLTAYDDREQHRTLVHTLDDRLAELGAALARARASLVQAGAKVSERSYDADLAAQRDAAESVVKSLAAQVDDYAAQRRTALAGAAKAQATEARLRAMVERVFVLRRVEDRPDGGYPFLLEYRAACPKYRALCPLPARDAEELRALNLGSGVPLACARYASYARIP